MSTERVLGVLLRIANWPTELALGEHGGEEDDCDILVGIRISRALDDV